MVSAKNFFTKQQQKQITDQIKKAETMTSAEIRVHLESMSGKDPLERAKSVFLKIGIDKTQKKTGILIYLCIKDKRFAIIGDEGVNKVVESNFWQSLTSVVEGHFKKDDFLNGILFAINELAESLKNSLPIKSQDINELPDKISY